LEGTHLADTHPADTLQTPEVDLKVGALQATAVGVLTAGPFPEVALALHCPPHAEGGRLAKLDPLQGMSLLPTFFNSNVQVMIQYIASMFNNNGILLTSNWHTAQHVAGLWSSVIRTALSCW